MLRPHLYEVPVLEPPLHKHQDVCVVGGGPAGLTAALTLGSAGRRVVLLESGTFSSSAAAQELNDGDHEGEAYAGLVPTRHRQLGGSANVWNVRVHGKPAAKYVPLSARDMCDWPIGWEELRPYYEEAQKLCGLGPFEYGAAHWSTDAHRPFELHGTGLTSAVYQFGYAERHTRELADQVRASEAISVASSTTVVELVVDRAARRVRAVRASDPGGRIVEMKPRVVILACGAIENARLLLLAGRGGGGSELLGRCFMEHARDFSLALLPHTQELFARAAFYDVHTSADGFLVGGYLGVADEALDAFALPNAAMTLIPRSRSRARRLAVRIPEPIRRVMGVAPDDRYGWSRVPSPAEAFDRFEIVLNLEQRPRPQNRIELSSRTDRFGNPLPRLQLRWTEEEQHDLERLRGLLRDWFRAAKLGDLKTSAGRRPDLSAHHHAGTTRMTLDPQDGVVDPDGRVFGVDNLYVTGASVFPTAGFANPTLTIVALARRLGHHLGRSRPAPLGTPPPLGDQGNQRRDSDVP